MVCLLIGSTLNSVHASEIVKWAHCPTVCGLTYIWKDECECALLKKQNVLSFVGASLYMKIFYSILLTTLAVVILSITYSRVNVYHEHFNGKCGTVHRNNQRRKITHSQWLQALRHCLTCSCSRFLHSTSKVLRSSSSSTSDAASSSSSSGEQGHLHEAKVSEGEVNRRLTSHELSYSGNSDKILFSANQLGVNRPVEDRWTAYQFGSLATNSLISGGSLRLDNATSATAHDDDQEETNNPFGGTIFTVVDGHGGHACAHAFNLLHADYLVSGLLPHSLFERALAEVKHCQQTGRPPQSISQLAQRLWTKPEASLTVPSERIRTLSPSDSRRQHLVPPRKQNWPPWGSWGPLASSVWQLHMNHMRKLFEEMLSTSFDGSGNRFDANEHGDIVDLEGYMVASRQLLIQSLLAKSSDPCHHQLLHVSGGLSSTHHHQQGFQQFLRSSSSTSSPTVLSEHLIDSVDLNRLQDRVCSTARNLRDSLRRFDLDVATSAQPSVSGPCLDKALLRIAFSGCVATCAYLPEAMDEVFISQVGDCGAVLGSLSTEQNSPPDEPARPNSPPLEFDASQWTGQLLIEPHAAVNESEVSRVKSEHPIHESSFVIREDRLLGELMPLRAFGDIRFKWSLEELKKVAHLLDLPPNYSITSSFYTSPPYLTATPQLVWRPLLPQSDYFLVLASDGLWDMLSPSDAIHVVAKHWFDYKRNPALSGPGDTAATRLVRTALGGDKMDCQQISVHFSMPATVARYYRDDITAIVVYLPAATRHLD